MMRKNTRQEMTAFGRVSLYGVALSAGIACLGAAKAATVDMQKCVQDCQASCAYFPNDKECLHMSEVCMTRCRPQVPSVTGATTNTPFSPMPPLRPITTCLSLTSAGDTAYWSNHCPNPVTVRASDDGKCQNWSCLDQVPAYGRVATSVSRHAKWCECPGTNSTCEVPANGC
jgi:hypothetical protein